MGSLEPVDFSPGVDFVLLHAITQLYYKEKYVQSESVAC